MSEDNVALVRGGLDAFLAGDMERVAALYRPDAIISASIRSQ